MSRAAIRRGHRDPRRNDDVFEAHELHSLARIVAAPRHRASLSGCPCRPHRSGRRACRRAPSTMIVAVPAFQHSPMFGHIDSSHTVLRRCSWTMSRVFAKPLPDGILARSQAGLSPRGTGCDVLALLLAVLDGREAGIRRVLVAPLGSAFRRREYRGIWCRCCS